MLQFMRHEFDVFVSTTIVEKRLDILWLTRSSSRMQSDMVYPSSTSCAGAWAGRTGERTATCLSSRIRN